MLVPKEIHLYVAGRRIHHGELGLLAIALGIAAVLDDIRDRHLWFRRA